MHPRQGTEQAQVMGFTTLSSLCLVSTPFVPRLPPGLALRDDSRLGTGNVSTETEGAGVQTSSIQTSLLMVTEVKGVLAGTPPPNADGNMKSGMLNGWGKGKGDLREEIRRKGVNQRVGFPGGPWREAGVQNLARCGGTGVGGGDLWAIGGRPSFSS